MSSPFGYRSDPFTGRYAFHNGTDYATFGKSPPIYSPFDGEVLTTGIDKCGALFIYIDYGDYVGMAYHLSKFTVKIGKVKRGDIIGYVGKTGRATGNHLHWSWIKNNGKALDYYNADYVDWEEEVLNEAEIKKIVNDILDAKDSKPSDYAKDAWRRAVDKEITDGTNAKGYATREQVVVMIERSL